MIIVEDDLILLSEFGFEASFELRTGIILTSEVFVLEIELEPLEVEPLSFLIGDPFQNIVKHILDEEFLPRSPESNDAHCKGLRLEHYLHQMCPNFPPSQNRICLLGRSLELRQILDLDLHGVLAVLRIWTLPELDMSVVFRELEGEAHSVLEEGGIGLAFVQGLVLRELWKCV